MIADLSREIAAGMVTYPGIAGPQLEVVMSREAAAARLGSGASFESESLTLAGNTGTYLDSPYHFHADRADLARLPLERLVNVPVAMVRAAGRTAVTAADLSDPGRLWGKAVLVHTNWARHWGTPRCIIGRVVMLLWHDSHPTSTSSDRHPPLRRPPAGECL